jgi:hypothetical protein
VAPSIRAAAPYIKSVTLTSRTLRTRALMLDEQSIGADHATARSKNDLARNRALCRMNQASLGSESGQQPLIDLEVCVSHLREPEVFLHPMVACTR